MTTNYKHIEDLLARFFEGETTCEEEQQLYDFFSRKNIPEHLLRYRPVFSYFENDLEEELQQREQGEQREKREKREQKEQGGRRWITLAIGVAASLLVLLMLTPLFMGKSGSFNPYEGSYIIRNGERITDISLIKPELEATIRQALQQEEEADRQLSRLAESEAPLAQIGQEIRQQQEDMINRFPDGMREEVKKIMESN